MPDLTLAIKHVSYLTEHHYYWHARRAFAKVEFATRLGPTVFPCVVDTGAACSVIPFSFWHDGDFQWKNLGSSLTRAGRPATEALEWQGIACDLGEMTVDLLDSQNGTRGGPYLMVAKFARRAHRQRKVENTALLGMNFIADNRLRLVIDSMSASLVGWYSIP